ncbi:hypothetical protein [Tenacibaculum finnmarkense]|uniref:hypothetical protein n=1 Tax=Tenacibaculum finnmarkense TaxID=2781243 RepID=UPI001EFB66F6|nr:hypothetical protein [Tenacibaculum finnmarkense]MCG8750562.1 hypothetical protein [Tenacibaculum finnmarkense]MCG8796598.1 hypothetical protein [Tenacibaculum finnmarkense]MCG8798932.1 hypothetical protein [Tenacibaculum finnmarkense]
MGLTISDRHQIMYTKWREQGMTHEEAMQNIPEKIRDRFLKDLQMSPIESHFGIKDKWFFATLIATVLGTIILAIAVS